MHRFIRGSIGAVAGATCVGLCVGLCVAGEPQGPSPSNDPSLRFAQASLRVAEAELDQSQQANKKAPGSVSATELRRLALQVEKHRAQIALLETGRNAVEINPSAKSTEAVIRKALDEKTVMEFVETPLQDVVEHLQKKHKISIQIDKKALDDAGLGTDTPITRNLKDISLRSALRLMLREFDLTWVIENEVLLLTTIDEAGQRLEMQVYDVDDLVTVAGEGDLDYDSLIDTITTIVAPNTWDEVGGPASISPLHRTLVISQTWEVHDQIAALLTEVRRVRKARGDKPLSKVPLGEAAEAAPVDPTAVSVKVYQVHVPLRQTPGLAAATPAPAGKETNSGTKPAQGGGFGGGTGGPFVPNDRYLEELAVAIPSLVSPETWKAGGGDGVIYSLPADSAGAGRLLVRQSAEVHAQLQRFLKEVQPKGSDSGGFGSGGGISAGGFF